MSVRQEIVFVFDTPVRIEEIEQGFVNASSDELEIEIGGDVAPSSWSEEFMNNDLVFRYSAREVCAPEVKYYIEGKTHTTVLVEIALYAKGLVLFLIEDKDQRMEMLLVNLIKSLKHCVYVAWFVEMDDQPDANEVYEAYQEGRLNSLQPYMYVDRSGLE